MMLINNRYDLKQIVYLLTDTEQLARIVVGIKVCADGCILYELACGTQETWHYEAEMSLERDAVKALG